MQRSVDFFLSFRAQRVEGEEALSHQVFEGAVGI